MSLRQCSICGTTTINQQTGQTQCAQVACLACGTVQCHSHGLARGTCRTCYYGRLPGWSTLTCSAVCTFKGCERPAVFRGLPGAKRDACLTHGAAVLARRAYGPFLCGDCGCLHPNKTAAEACCTMQGLPCRHTPKDEQAAAEGHGALSDAEMAEYRRYWSDEERAKREG